MTHYAGTVDCRTVRDDRPDHRICIWHRPVKMPFGFRGAAGRISRDARRFERGIVRHRSHIKTLPIVPLAALMRRDRHADRVPYDRMISWLRREQAPVKILHC